MYLTFCLQPELYLCTPVRIDYGKNYYIVGFEPNATMETAHHMLIYGCTTPGSSKPIWNCGEMANAGHLADTAPACKEGTQVILRSPNIFYEYILDTIEEKIHLFI